MCKLCASCQRWSPYFLSVMRIVLASLFMCHGGQKIFEIPSLPPEALPPDLFSLLGISGIIELAGGFLLLAGLFTRTVAFVLCGEMAVAYCKAHLRFGWWPIHNHGELALVYCFVFLYLFTAGPGPWSVDGWWARRRAGRPAAA